MDNNIISFPSSGAKRPSRLKNPRPRSRERSTRKGATEPIKQVLVIHDAPETDFHHQQADFETLKFKHPLVAGLLERIQAHTTIPVHAIPCETLIKNRQAITLKKGSGEHSVSLDALLSQDHTQHLLITTGTSSVSTDEVADELARTMEGWQGWTLVSSLLNTATYLARFLENPERAIGYCPTALLNAHQQEQPLLEVVAPLQAQTLIQELDQHPVIEFIKHLGCQPAWVEEDVPGLVLGRLWATLANEACSALSESVATVEDIDQAMRLGTRYPIGPLAWADWVGVDTTLYILESLAYEYGDRYRPMPRLRRMVDAGWLGRKSGQGFYRYPDETPPISP